MKRLVLTFSDDAFEAIRLEAKAYKVGPRSLMSQMIQAIEDKVEVLEIKTRSEREEESCLKP